MKKINKTLGVALTVCSMGIAAASGAAQSAQFNVGIQIVDPCVLKGQKWEQQCAQLKKQRQQQSKPQAKKRYKKQPKSEFPG
ncbi:hypothetical protein [Mesorhizobium sp. SP-1A]|uniref:hypothetical protein n=1 Tax=Mesorhizobium sp. SP-1A TaxID=3077840 RepID=UPI0028F739BD|nr:hypothetical protein [Mesorhizobium sp. SP-1A]